MAKFFEGNLPTKLVNLTSHPIHILGVDCKTVVLTIPSTGLVRLKANTVWVGTMGLNGMEGFDRFTNGGVRFTATEFSEPEGLPEPVEGTYLIVSQLVKTALPNRKDLVVPAEVIRDTNNNIVGCRSLGI